MNAERELEALDASLARRFRVVDTPVDVGVRTLSIRHPASSEDLIDERDFERDERLPYWAELWPSSRVLGALVVAMDGAGRSLLDLGCGAGVVSTCAAFAGFRVTASDYYEDAVRFARVNAWQNAGVRIEGLALDWRYLPADLQRFDTVVASDVLYEQPYGELVARVIDATLAAHGVAYLADPGRVGRDAFLRALDARKLSMRTRSDLPFVDGVIRQTIAVFEIGRA